MRDGCLGCEMIATAPVTLRSGLTVCSSCPEWRLEKEAKMVLMMTARSKRTEYLDDIDKIRGKAAGKLLRDEVLAQWDAKVTK